MDQKRTVWIVIATGVFLLVVVCAALILSAPSAKRETTVETLGSDTVHVAATTIPSVPQDTFAHGTVTTPNAAEQTPPDANADGTTQTDNLTVIATGTTNVIGLGDTNATSGTTTIDLNTLKSGSSTNVTANNTIAENAMHETQAAHAVTPATSSVSAQQVETTSPKATSTENASNATKTAKPSAKTATPTKKTGTSTKNTPTVKPADKFWVQAAAYSSKKTAEEARTTLDSNKIPCEIFTYKDSKGTMFYRVRVGPYTTKSEAEYWKDRIDAIDLFKTADSYVTNSSAVAK